MYSFTELFFAKNFDRKLYSGFPDNACMKIGHFFSLFVRVYEKRTENLRKCLFFYRKKRGEERNHGKKKSRKANKVRKK